MYIMVKNKQSGKIIGHVVGKTQSPSGIRYMIVQKLYSKAKPKLIEISDDTHEKYDLIKVSY